ncbi:MAG: hypothetical protein RLZZ609_3125 [Cyanobacteriota bacterium]|jgi:type I restriction enzyme S subunit
MSKTETYLGEIFHIERGGSPRPIQHYLTDEADGVPWIMIGDTRTGGKYIDSTRTRIKKEGIRKSREVFPGELLLSNSMSFGRPYILQTYGCIHDGWLVLRPKRDDIDIDYAYHALGSAQAMAQFQRQAAGATVKNLNKEIVASTQIPLPPLEEQRRIAAILDKAQDVKAMVAQRSCLLTALGRSLFVRRFGLPSENPYELTTHRLVDICNPKQWPTISSKQLKEAGYPVFGANGLIGYYDTFNHQEPTVLVTCRGATCGTVNVSPPNCYVTGNSMAMDNPDPALITTEYLAWVLRLRSMHDVISGSAQPQITRQGLEAVTIPVPPIDAQKDFEAELRALARVDDSSRFSEVSLFEVSNCLAGQLLGSSSA